MFSINLFQPGYCFIGMLYHWKLAGAKIRVHISGLLSWLQTACLQHYTYLTNKIYKLQKYAFSSCCRRIFHGGHFVSQTAMANYNSSLTRVWPLSWKYSLSYIIRPYFLFQDKKTISLASGHYVIKNYTCIYVWNLETPLSY